MTCQDYQHLWEQHGALEAGPHQQPLHAHAAACPTCRALIQAEHTLRRQLAPSPPEGPPPHGPPPELLSRLHAKLEPLALPVSTSARESTARVRPMHPRPAQPLSSPRPFPLQRPFPLNLTRVARALGMTGVLLAGVLLSRLLWPPDTVRLKGDVPTQPLSLDLQASVERTGGDGLLHLERAEEGLTLSAQAGLIFRFTAQGGTQLVLVERSPAQRLTVLLEKTGLDPQGPPSTVEPTSPEGHPLRYQPDGGAGDYTVLALLLPAPQAITPERLEQLWERHVTETMHTAQAGASPPEPAPSSAASAGEGVIESFRFTYQPGGVPPTRSGTAGGTP